jgi:hypothetical protein
MVNKILTQFYDEILAAEFPESIKDIIKQKYTELWCRAILRAGTQCKSAPLEGSLKCKRHSGRPCAAILCSGVNRGRECGTLIRGDGQFCSKHANAAVPKERPVKAAKPVRKRKVIIEEEEETSTILKPIIPAVSEPIIPAVSEPIIPAVLEPIIPVKKNVPKLAVEAPKKYPKGYVRNIVQVSGPFETFPESISGCLAVIKKTGKRCGKAVQPDSLACKTHQGTEVQKPSLEGYLPEHKWVKGGFWDNLVKNYEWVPLAAGVKTSGLRVCDLARDNDDIIDSKEQLPRVVHSTCMYSDESLCTDERFVTVCGERVADGLHFCQKHRRAESKMHCANLFTPDLWRSAVDRVQITAVAGYLQLVNLGLFAHLTRNGPIIVGKLWLGAYAEQLNLCRVRRNLCYRDLNEEEIKEGMPMMDEYNGHEFPSEEAKLKHMKRYPYNNNPTEGEDEETLILRCHNNGLLYKILPQEHLMYQYDITNLDSLPGKGFVSFEQMIRDRPKLYIKYWNVWNQHIERAREWLTLKSSTPLEIWKQTGITAWMNWEEIEEGLKGNGGYNIVIPAPSLELVKSAAFNPFRYCEEWVQSNRPDEAHRPHCPPMYILYSFPEEEYQRCHKAFRASSLHDVVRFNPKNVEHYNYSVLAENPYTFLQALKFGNPDVYSTKSYDVPYKLQKRLGYEKWCDRRR